jgi:hypothetical protein
MTQSNDPTSEPSDRRDTATTEARPVRTARFPSPASHVQSVTGERGTSGISIRRSREDVEVRPIGTTIETTIATRRTSGISIRRDERSVEAMPIDKAKRTENSRMKK